MSHFVTYIALSEFGTVTAKQVAARYRTHFGDEGFAVSLPDGQESPQQFVMRLDDVAVTVMFVNAALSPKIYEEALLLDRNWPEAKGVLQASRAYAIVALLNKSDDHIDHLNGAAAVTMVAGVLAELLPSLAVISTEGRSILKPVALGPLVAGLMREEIPVSFWTSMAFFSGEVDNGVETVGAVSVGMIPFIGREIEFPPTTMPAYDTMRYLLALTEYLILEGMVVKDGDAVAVSSTQALRATYKDEGRLGPVPIISLRLENLDRSGPSPAINLTDGPKEHQPQRAPEPRSAAQTQARPQPPPQAQAQARPAPTSQPAPGVKRKRRGRPKPMAAHELPTAFTPESPVSMAKRRRRKFGRRRKILSK